MKWYKKMNFKEFQELKASKSPEEFRAWFDDIACWYIDVDGDKLLCAKVAKRKAFLRDGTLVEVDHPEQLQSALGDSRDLLKSEQDLIRKYSNLNPLHHAEISNHIKELWREEEDEKNPDKRAVCAFCGKKEYEVDKMIAGPDGLYICGECVEECHQILMDKDSISDT